MDRSKKIIPFPFQQFYTNYSIYNFYIAKVKTSRCCQSTFVTTYEKN